MDQETFTKLAAVVNHIHLSASKVAALIILPLLLLSAIGGFLLAHWIFRGGLSRSAFRVRGSR